MTDRTSPAAALVRMLTPARGGLALAVTLLAGCSGALQPDAVARLLEPEPIAISDRGPPDAAPGSCWGREQIPAVIETETHQIMLQPSQINSAGALLEPPIYKTETRQRIVRERRELWFETICPADMSPEFIASVQRALMARDLYSGPINGEMTARTRAAIRQFQTSQGLDSAVLSVAAAQQMGLVAITPEDG